MADKGWPTSVSTKIFFQSSVVISPEMKILKKKSQLLPDLHLMRLVDRTAVHKLEDMFYPIPKREICFRYQLQRAQVQVTRSCPFHFYCNPIKRIFNCHAAIYGSNDYSILSGGQLSHLGASRELKQTRRRQKRECHLKN